MFPPAGPHNTSQRFQRAQPKKIVEELLLSLSTRRAVLANQSLQTIRSFWEAGGGFFPAAMLAKGPSPRLREVAEGAVARSCEENGGELGSCELRHGERGTAVPRRGGTIY